MFKIRGADGKDYGPVTADQLRGWIQQRRANAQTLIQLEGSEEWKPLSEFPEFEANLAPTAAPAPAMTAPGLGASQPVSTAKPRANPLAITSLVLGILSLLCCGMLGMFFAILALIFGGLGISQIKKSSEPMTGRGMAIAGIVMGSIGLIFGAVLTIWLFNGGREQLMELIQQK